jgi:hypothetical protein
MAAAGVRRHSAFSAPTGRFYASIKKRKAGGLQLSILYIGYYILLFTIFVATTPLQIGREAGRDKSQNEENGDFEGYTVCQPFAYVLAARHTIVCTGAVKQARRLTWEELEIATELLRLLQSCPID